MVLRVAFLLFSFCFMKLEASNLIERDQEYEQEKPKSLLSVSTNLQELTLTKEALNFSIDDLSRFTNLTVLRLPKQKLPTDTSLDSLSGLTRLKALDISFNNLLIPPSSLSSLQALEELNLRGNEFIERQFIDRVGQSYLIDNLANYESVPRAIPESVFQLPHLQTLDVCLCGLIIMPPELANLTALTHLSFFGNRLYYSDSFPQHLSALTALREIYFTNGLDNQMFPVAFNPLIPNLERVNGREIAPKDRTFKKLAELLTEESENFKRAEEIFLRSSARR